MGKDLISRDKFFSFLKTNFSLKKSPFDNFIYFFFFSNYYFNKKNKHLFNIKKVKLKNSLTLSKKNKLKKKFFKNLENSLKRNFIKQKKAFKPFLKRFSPFNKRFTWKLNNSFILRRNSNVFKIYTKFFLEDLNRTFNPSSLSSYIFRLTNRASLSTFHKKRTLKHINIVYNFVRSKNFKILRGNFFSYNSPFHIFRKKFNYNKRFKFKGFVLFKNFYIDPLSQKFFYRSRIKHRAAFYRVSNGFCNINRSLDLLKAPRFFSRRNYFDNLNFYYYTRKVEQEYDVDETMKRYINITNGKYFNLKRSEKRKLDKKDRLEKGRFFFKLGRKLRVNYKVGCFFNPNIVSRKAKKKFLPGGSWERRKFLNIISNSSNSKYNKYNNNYIKKNEKKSSNLFLKNNFNLNNYNDNILKKNIMLFKNKIKNKNKNKIDKIKKNSLKLYRKKKKLLKKKFFNNSFNSLSIKTKLKFILNLKKVNNKKKSYFNDKFFKLTREEFLSKKSKLKFLFNDNNRFFKRKFKFLNFYLSRIYNSDFYFFYKFLSFYIQSIREKRNKFNLNLFLFLSLKNLYFCNKSKNFYFIFRKRKIKFFNLLKFEPFFFNFFLSSILKKKKSFFFKFFLKFQNVNFIKKFFNEFFFLLLNKFLSKNVIFKKVINFKTLKFHKKISKKFLELQKNLKFFILSIYKNLFFFRIIFFNYLKLFSFFSNIRERTNKDFYFFFKKYLFLSYYKVFSEERDLTSFKKITSISDMDTFERAELYHFLDLEYIRNKYKNLFYYTFNFFYLKNDFFKFICFFIKYLNIRCYKQNVNFKKSLVSLLKNPFSFNSKNLLKKDVNFKGNFKRLYTKVKRRNRNLQRVFNSRIFFSSFFFFKNFYKNKSIHKIHNLKKLKKKYYRYSHSKIITKKFFSFRFFRFYFFFRNLKNFFEYIHFFFF